MTTKDLEWRLTADPTGVERGFKSAEQSAAAFERELAKMEARQKRVDDAMTRTGHAALGAGAAIAAGLGLAANAAVQWESAWTGVAKVVSGTPEELADLEQQIRALTKVLPQSHEEIAGVAAAAGQLGVKRQDIAEFTKVMVMMGTATNLSSEDAAFALARLMNIMQTAPQDVGRLGAAVVNLGNNFATTEAEIVEMATRISGAGHTIGMSEADVLGYAAALSSVGINAEAGGTAISTAFIKIAASVRSGGDQLDKFAQVAGMSSKDFQKAFAEDPAAAMAAFIGGLSRMQKAGGDVFGTLEELGLSEIRLRTAMLNLAGAGDVLTGALKTAHEGWDEDTALLQEAERRYGTTAAKIQLAKNSVNDLGISLGQYLLPIMGKTADVTQNVMEFFAGLPEPIQAGVVIVAALTAGFLLLGGAALVLVPKLAAAKAAVDTLANSEGRLAAMTVATTAALGRAASFLAGPWGIAIGVAVTALGAFGVAQAAGRDIADELKSTLDQQTGAITDNTRAWIAHELEQRGVLKVAQELGIGAADLVDTIVAVGEGAEVTAEQMTQMQQAMLLANLQNADSIEGYFSAQEGMLELAAALKTAQEAQEREAQATGEATDATEKLDPATRQLATTLGLTADEAKAFNDELDALDKELKAVFDSVFGLSDAQADLEDAVDRLTERIKAQREANVEGAGGFDLSTEAGRENYAVLKDIAEAQAQVVLRTLEQTQSASEAAAVQAEFTARMQALADQLGIDITQVEGYNEAVAAIEREVQTKLQLEKAQALADIQKYKDWLASIPKEVVTKLIAEEHKGGVHEYATGGWAVGAPGVDNVPARVSAGEFMVTPVNAARNAAVLEAINAGAQIPLYGTAGGAGAAGGGGNSYEYNIYPAATVLDAAQLQLITAQQEAKDRAGRAR